MVQYHVGTSESVSLLFSLLSFSGKRSSQLSPLSLPSVARGPNNSVPDEAFGDEVNLVVWGHEHDCISQARPVPVTNRPYYISQPGSSIATSLAKGEAIPKYVIPFSSPLLLFSSTELMQRERE